MVKSFKKAIAILVSVLMIATSLPFTALTANAEENAGLNTAISAYESKMNGTIYNNMKAAYDAYVTACYAKEALSVGDTTTYNIANVTSALNSATNAMTAWSAYTGTKKGSYVDDSVKTTEAYNKAWQNVLWAETGLGASGDAFKAEGIVAGKSDYKANCYMQYKDTTLLYDGTNPTGFVMTWEMGGNSKPWNYNWDNLRVHYIFISSNEGFKYKTKWGPNQGTYDSTWGITQNPGNCDIVAQTSKSANGMNGKKISNVLYYEPSSAPTEIMSAFQPSITFNVGYDKGNTTYSNQKMGNRTIYVLNYAKVKETLNAKNDLLKNVASYRQGGLSNILSGVDKATIDPNSFFTSANNQATCGANYKDAVDLMESNATKDSYKTITGKKGSDVLGTFTLSTGCKASTVKAALDSVLTEKQGRDADYHYDYSWPATTDVTADATYNVVTKAGDHDQNGTVVSETPATCETDGQKVVECSICRQEQTITLTKTGHAYGDSTKDWDAYVDEDTTYTHTKVCANDDSHKVTANCSFSAWTDDGEGNQTRTCSVCGGVQSRVAEAGKVSYTFQLPNGTVVENKEVDADTVVDAPALDSYAYNDETGHHTFTWENAQYTITENTTITASEDVQEHTKDTKNVNFVNVDEDTLLATSCNESRTYSYDVLTYCTECDVTFGSVTNNVDPLAHTSTEYALNTDDTTTHNVSCAVCHKVTSTESHNFTTNTVDPTCTAQGYTTYTCEDCEYSYNADFTELAAHSYGDYISLGDGTHKRVCIVCLYEDINSCEMTGSIVNPTCTDAGYYTMKCTLCDYDTGKQDLVIEASEYCDTAYPSQYGQDSYSASYKFVDKNGVIKPTKMVVTVKHRLYNTDGFAGIGASRGSVTITGGDGASQSYTTSGTNTNPSDKFITLETNSDSFTITGSKITGNGSNNSCGIEITNIKVYADLPALGHDYSVVVPSSAVDATCTVDGKNADMKCSRCDDVQTGSTIGKLGHSFTNYVSNDDATCQKNATQTAQCDRCDATDTKDIDNSTVAHSYELTDTVEAGHTENGKNVYTCKWCDDVMEEPIFAAGHTAGAPTVEDAVNVDANGVATSCDPTLEYSYNLVTRCTECTEIMTSVPTTVNPLAHTEVTDDAVVADCITEGLTEGKHCSVCETVIVAQTNIGKDATNHAGTVALDESTVVAATAETKGYTGDKICDACNEVAEAGQETDALGYKITFKTKAGASVEHNFPVGTTADELRAWAVENAPIDAPTSTSHFSWSAYTNSGMVTVAKNATYTMSTASDKGAIRHTYDDVFSEADGMIYRDAATCKGCDYERAYTRMEASYTNAEGEEVYAINLSTAITEAVKLQNSTVKVYGDVDYTVTAIKSISASDRTVTIDLNGATVTAPNGLKLAGSGAWVITGDGTITTGETNKSIYPVAYTGSGSLTINSGYFYSDKDEEGKGNATIFMNSTSDDAKIIINDGTFEAGAPYGSKYFVLNKLDGSNGTIEVNGGTFVKYNPIEDSEVNVNEAKIVDDTVADIYTVFDGDFSAYNAAVAEANVLNEDEYTEESWADLQTALANDTTRLQSGINAATAAIQTAIENLVAKSGLKVTVNVQIDGEDAGALEYTDLSYGDPIHIDLTGKLADASIQKWTIEQANAITKLSMTDKTYDMVVTANATITVYATADATPGTRVTKVKFTDRGYRTIGYGYVENTSEIDVNNITPIDGASIVAPTIAFYDFVCWEEVAGNVYAATYEVTAHNVCNVKTDFDTIEINGTKSDLVDYDTNIEITYTGTKPLGIKIGDKVMPITDLANVHAPYGYEMVEIVEIDETPVATSMITGKFTRDVDAGKKIAAFNAMYYLPEGCTLVECGVYAKKSESFTIDTLNTAAKVRSQSQSSNNEYTISMQSNYAADGVTKVYGMSYVTYKTAGGEINTVYGDLAVINL